MNISFTIPLWVLLLIGGWLGIGIALALRMAINVTSFVNILLFWPFFIPLVIVGLIINEIEDYRYRKGKVIWDDKQGKWVKWPRNL